MLHRDDGFSLNSGVIIAIVLIIVAFLGGYWLASTNASINSANLSELTSSDKNFLVQTIGGAVLQFSDHYCEKNGLKSDLLPQTLNVTDQNTGLERSVEYFVPVCVR